MNSERAFRAGQRVVARGRTWSVVDATPFVDCTAVSLRESAGSGATPGRTLLAPFDRFRTIEPPSRLRTVRPRRWLHALRQAACNARPFGGLSTAIDTSIDLLAYQLEPALAAIRDGTSRILIADAVGLGKTVQAGLLLSELAARTEQMHALVLTPAGLRAQWSRELATHFSLPASIADSSWLARSARELPADVNPWLLPRIYIASYDFVKRPEVLRALEDLAWDAVIVDEAHNATTGSARLAAVHAVALRARHVVLLTATPHSGNAADFDSLCSIGTTDLRRDPIVLFRRAHDPIAGRRRRTALLGIRLSPAERRMHRLLEQYSDAICREAAPRGDAHARLAVTILRKRALSSAGSLAISARRRLELLWGAADPAQQLALPLADEEPLADEPPDSALRAPGLADAVRERRTLERILRAAEEAARAESKITRLGRLIARLREPVIVFTEYRDTLARLRRTLHAARVHTAVLHGGQSAAERDAVQRQFNEDGGVLLATDAAAEGLNLHARCRTVVHFELPWNPGRLQQRTGRVDRIGQQRTVHEIAFVAADTAERLVLVPLLRRLARAARDLGDTNTLPLLTESQVAAAVLEGTIDGLAEDAILSSDLYVPAPPDLAAAAEAEVARLQTLRCWKASRGVRERRRHRSTIPVATIATRRSEVPEGAIMIQAVKLSSAAGRTVHSSLACVHSATAVADPGLTAAAARDLEAVGAAHRRHSAATAARARTVLARFASVSRELVQAGLFDARSVRVRERDTEADARSAGDIQRQIAQLEDPALSASIELVAVLMVRKGAGRR